MLLRPLRHGHVVFPNPISLPSGKKGSSTGSEKCQGSFLRDVVSGSLQRFFPAGCCFPTMGFVLVSPSLVARESCFAGLAAALIKSG